MPVTFPVASHQPRRVNEPEINVDSPQDLLDRTWGRYAKNSPQALLNTAGGRYMMKNTCVELLQSSMGSARAPVKLTNTLFRRNGFVDTIISAYSNHHHLAIRPDDVWMAILGQFNFYVNAHAEELRSHFVAHEGKKELVVIASGTRYTVDFGDLPNQMSDKIYETCVTDFDASTTPPTANVNYYVMQVVDKDLKAWIPPDFTTTTHNDTVICSVLMMATYSVYFQYRMDMWCGVPEVTLEGEKKTTKRYSPASTNSPVLAKSQHSGLQIRGSLHLRLDNRFLKLSPPPEPDDLPLTDEDYMDPQIFARLEYRRAMASRSKDKSIIDNVEFRSIDIADVPVGFCEVEVKVNDNGEELRCLMVAGHVASTIEGDDSDSLRSVPAWFMLVQG